MTAAERPLHSVVNGAGHSGVHRSAETTAGSKARARRIAAQVLDRVNVTGSIQLPKPAGVPQFDLALPIESGRVVQLAWDAQQLRWRVGSR